MDAIMFFWKERERKPIVAIGDQPINRVFCGAVLQKFHSENSVRIQTEGLFEFVLNFLNSYWEHSRFIWISTEDSQFCQIK